MFAHCKIRYDDLVDNAATTANIEPPAEVIEELHQHIRSLCYNNPMDINFLLNHPDEKQVNHVPNKEEILAWVVNPTLVDGDDDDNTEVQRVFVVDGTFMLNQLHKFWLQQSDTGNEFTGAIQKMKVFIIQQKSLFKNLAIGIFQRKYLINHRIQQICTEILVMM